MNAFLAQDLIEPLVWVEILNPYNDKEFLSDKLSIVDVKARDSHDRLYQIEIQLTSYGHLPARIIYNWADIYSQQLRLPTSDGTCFFRVRLNAYHLMPRY
ncbi:MAG: PD-(D/E)XK nuclease family transposase [Methylococcaceae bacterium]